MNTRGFLNPARTDIECQNAERGWVVPSPWRIAMDFLRVVDLAVRRRQAWTTMYAMIWFAGFSLR